MASHTDLQAQNNPSTSLMWTLLQDNSLFGPSPIDLKKPGIKDFNPRDVSIEMLFILVLNNQGMNPIQEMMAQIAQDQEIQDALDGNNIDFSSILAEMEQAAGSGGFKPGTSVTQFMTELRQFFQKAYGQLTQDSSGNYVPVSGSNSSFAQFINMLKAKYGAKWESNPAFSTIETMVKGFMNPAPGGGGLSWYQLMSSSSNSYNNTLFAGALDTAAANYYKATNGSGNGGTNDFADMYTNASASQSALQGMGSENTAMLQTDAATLNSFDQTGQNAITGFNQGINSMINNQRAP